MKSFINLSILICSIGVMVFGSVSAADGRVLSFREWKAEKVVEAKGQVNDAKEKIKKENDLDSLDQIMDQQVWRLEAARDLSITDYLVLYLSSQNSPKKFKDAAQHLTKDEVAEIMEAYARAMSLQGPGRGTPSLSVQAADQNK